MLNYLKTILIVLFILGQGISSWSEIYVWEDENGVKHFSNKSGSQDQENVTVQDEIKWSEDEEEKWERQKKETRVKHKQNMSLTKRRDEEQARKTQKCSEAKAAYEKVKRDYAEFVPEPLPRAGDRPAAMRLRRTIKKQNEEKRKKWEVDKAQAIGDAKKDMEASCRD